MQMNSSVTLNLHLKEASDEVKAAAGKALIDCVVDTTQDAKENSPYLTGNNRRSINMEVGPGGDLQLKELQGAVFSSSGYGGFLETGTIKMAPRPYIKPAADKDFTPEKMAEGIKRHLGET